MNSLMKNLSLLGESAVGKSRVHYINSLICDCMYCSFCIVFPENIIYAKLIIYMVQLLQYCSLLE